MKTLVSFVLLAGLVQAHVVVRPPESGVGQEQAYTMRVPNEKQVVTTSVRLDFPEAIRVTSVRDVAGWKLVLEKDAGGRILRAVWSGSLAPKESVEFTFTARNPDKAGTVEWKAIQEFQDGSRSEWTGPEGSRTPASQTKIGAGSAAK